MSSKQLTVLATIAPKVVPVEMTFYSFKEFYLLTSLKVYILNPRDLNTEYTYASIGISSHQGIKE